MKGEQEGFFLVGLGSGWDDDLVVGGEEGRQTEKNKDVRNTIRPGKSDREWLKTMITRGIEGLIGVESTIVVVLLWAVMNKTVRSAHWVG